MTGMTGRRRAASQYPRCGRHRRNVAQRCSHDEHTVGKADGELVEPDSGASRRRGAKPRAWRVPARRCARHPVLSRDEEHELAVRYVQHARAGAGAQAHHREPAPGRQDRPGVPPRAPQPARPHPGRQRRPHPGGAALRPVSRREAFDLRRLVDPRLHPEVHPGQLAHRQDRHHAGAAAAVLQPQARARAHGADGRSRRTAKRLAAALDVSEGDVVEMERRLAASEMSLDAPGAQPRACSGARRATWSRPVRPRAPTCRSKRASSRSCCGSSWSVRRRPRRIASCTSSASRLLADQPTTLEQIGADHGVSRERARQIEERLKKRLRVFLETELGDSLARRPGSRDPTPK